MRILPTLLALATTLALGATVHAADWHHDLDHALEDAGSCDGEILLDVYTTWCGPCRRLANEVFNTQVFADASAGMVLAKIDAESGDGPDVARRFAVVGYPTVLVLDPRGNEIDRLFGFFEAEEFASRLREIRYGVPTVSEFLASYSAPAPDEVFSMTFDRGFDAASCGQYDVADRLLETLVDLDADNSTGFASSALLVLGKYRHLRGGHDPDTAIRYFDRIIEQFPESADVESAIVQSGIAHARAGRETESLQSFEAYLSIAPEDADRANAVAFSMALESVALDRAQAIAEYALESSPEDDSLWNTLAEVHFANGEVDAAITAIDQAIAHSSDPSYYREQRARFESLE